MSTGDETVERDANRLERAAQKASAHGGLRARLSNELADDAAFLRKLKPSLIKARVKGEPTAAAPSGPQLRRPSVKSGLNPFAVAAAALAAGILLAKLVDWRSHAHPRR
ncbi:MAG: hypothetical protein M3168_01585 [Actinomycetota bacterium]|nr:hypothetical protein [Actinomycetota bacterium]